MNRLGEYQAELHTRTQGIIDAKTKAAHDLEWIKDNVVKMEEALAEFHDEHKQVSSEKKQRLRNNLAAIEKRMGERALEVEARLKDAAATVMSLKNKVCGLEKDYKTAKLSNQTASASKNVASPPDPPPSTASSSNVIDTHDIIKERLEVAEAQLSHDSDLVSKLYDRVCVLNNSLVEARNRGMQGAITPYPRRLYVKLHRHPKSTSSCEGETSAQTSPRDDATASGSAAAAEASTSSCKERAKDEEHLASTSAACSLVTSPTEDEINTATLPRPLNEHEVDWILHVCGKNFEDVGIKLSDANEKVISQLRDRVRVLTDEAKKDRTPSPGRRSPEAGTSTPTRTGAMSPAAAVTPFQPSPDVVNIGEAPSVTVQKMEDALANVQFRCKSLAAEIDYMEKKKAAAMDAMKTLDAAIAEKLPLLKSATLDANRLRRCLKRPEEEEAPVKETRIAHLIKLFKKPDKNLEKYLINKRGNKFDV